MTGKTEPYKILEKAIRISNSSVDIERRLNNMLGLIKWELSVDRCLLFNFDPDSDTLILRATSDDGEAPKMVLGLDDNVLGRAVSSRQTVAAENGPESWSADCRDLFEGYQALIAFPVMDDQMVHGVLLLLREQSAPFAADLVDLIETVCREMAGTIRSARLYQDSRKRIAELSVLYEVGRAVSSSIELDQVLHTVVNISSKMLLAEGSALTVIDAATGELKVTTEYGKVPPEYSFKDLAEEQRVQPPAEVLACVRRPEPYLGPAGQDPVCPMRGEAGLESVLALPLHFKSNFKGTLSVFNKVAAPPGRQRAFSREDLELLSTMGAMISSSLENALTYKAANELARHNQELVKNLSCLYEVSGALMTTVKTSEVLSIIVNALTLKQSLNFDRAMVLVMDEDEQALRGTAYRQMTPQRREHNGGRLSEALSRVEGVPVDDSEAGRRFSELRLPLEDGGVLAGAAREHRGFLGRPGDGNVLAEQDLFVEFGRNWYATMPMLAKEKVVGVIAVDRDLSGGTVTDQDLRSLSMLANQAALAIENSQLYEYIEQANLSLSQTKERLLEAEKMAALGEMAAGMAHEIRNPLVSIGGFTRRLLKNLEADSPHRVYIEVIINEVTRLEKTLGEILDFSRDTLGHLAEHDLNQVVSEALFILRRDFKDSDIEVVKNLGDIPLVLIDERQIKHVFFNLFFNATQAMEGGGRLTVHTYATQIGDRAFAACEVSDTGPGISAEVLPNIFNPFFTTKDAGTGLGLSIVHKIISRHHGEIDVVNLTDQGATFIVKLPVAAEAGLYLK